MHAVEAGAVAERSPRLELSSRLLSRESLSAGDRGRMYALLSRHFDGVDPGTFEQDLAEKSHVVLVEDARGELRGFTTFLMYGTRVLERDLTVVYSGDTIVDPEAWGSPVLPRAWIRAVYDLRSGFPPGELYWLLLTSGFRTYRFLSVFWRRFYPCVASDTPGDAQALLDGLAASRFGAAFDPATGVVRFARPQVLRARLIDVPAGRRADPHVRFFLERNPGYTRGDELVSLTSLERDNLTAAGRRMAG